MVLWQLFKLISILIQLWLKGGFCTCAFAHLAASDCLIQATYSFWAKYLCWLFPLGCKGWVDFCGSIEHWFGYFIYWNRRHPSQYFVVFWSDLFCTGGCSEALCCRKAKVLESIAVSGQSAASQSNKSWSINTPSSAVAEVTAILRALFLKKLESQVVILISVCLSLCRQTFRA